MNKMRGPEEHERAWRPAVRQDLAPDLARVLHAPAELGPLLVLGQQVALLGAGEAALRRQAELVERREFRRLFDTPLELVLALELAGLGRHDAQHDLLALREKTQRLEAAGAVGVVLHEI